MPQAIAGFLVAALASIGVSGAIVAAVVNVAVVVGTSLLVSSIFGPSAPKPSDGQQNVRVGVGSRRRHYGIVHTGGQETFAESRNGTLARVITLGTGREAEILEHRIDNKPVTVVGGTVTEASYHGALHIHTRPGEDDQTAIGELSAKFAEWTSDHRQRGCAHAAIICDPVDQKLFAEVYNNRMPEYTQVRKAALVYDPRLDSTAVIGTDEVGAPIMGSGPVRLNDRSTWPWSDNAALVIADYFAHPDGYGGGYENVNWTRIAQEADQSDTAVTTVTSETIARWRIWASYSLASEERRQVLTGMLKACDGFCWQDADGKFNLITGRFEEPAVTLTDDHILGMTATLGPKAHHRISAVKVLYTEAAIGYREQESATIADLTAGEDPNTDPQAVEAFYAPHHNQASRLGKLTLAQLGDRWHVVAELNLFGLNLLGERFTRFDSQLLGVAGYFMVSGLRLNLLDLTVEATLDEVTPADWEFDAAIEEGAPPSMPGASSSVPSIDVPTGLSLSAVNITLGETNGVAIAASWDDPARPGLAWEVQYRPTAGGDWVPMSVNGELFTAQSGLVDSGTSYDVRIRALSISLRTSAWSATETITPVATLVLAAPSELTATGGTGSASITFRMPTQSSLAYARLYSGTSSSFGAATQVGSDIVGGLGEVMSITHSGLSAGARYYWARAYNGSGGSSALAGPVSTTIS